MSMSNDQARFMSNECENDGVSIGAASTMKFEMGTGSDTSSVRYLNLPGGISYGVELIPTVACSITIINDKTLKQPLSVGTGGWKPINMKIRNFTIQTGSATVVEVFGKV